MGKRSSPIIPTDNQHPTESYSKSTSTVSLSSSQHRFRTYRWRYLQLIKDGLIWLTGKRTRGAASGSQSMTVLAAAAALRKKKELEKKKFMRFKRTVAAKYSGRGGKYYAQRGPPKGQSFKKMPGKGGVKYAKYGRAGMKGGKKDNKGRNNNNSRKNPKNYKGMKKAPPRGRPAGGAGRQKKVGPGRGVRTAKCKMVGPGSRARIVNKGRPSKNPPGRGQGRGPRKDVRGGKKAGMSVKPLTKNRCAGKPGRPPQGRPPQARPPQARPPLRQNPPRLSKSKCLLRVNACSTGNINNNKPRPIPKCKQEKVSKPRGRPAGSKNSQPSRHMSAGDIVPKNKTAGGASGRQKKSGFPIVKRNSVHAGAKRSMTGGNTGRRGRTIFTSTNPTPSSGGSRVVTRSISRRKLNIDVMSPIQDVCPDCVESA